MSNATDACEILIDVVADALHFLFHCPQREIKQAISSSAVRHTLTGCAHSAVIRGRTGDFRKQKPPPSKALLRAKINNQLCKLLGSAAGGAKAHEIVYGKRMQFVIKDAVMRAQQEVSGDTHLLD